MPGIYGIVGALQAVRGEVQNLSADMADAVEQHRQLASAAREAERAADTTSRVTGGSPVTVKGLAAALRSTAGRTT